MITENLKKFGELQPREDYRFQKIISGTYFNIVFNPIKLADYNDFQKAYSFSFPNELTELYKECNGCRLFSGSVSLFGYIKKKDTTQQQPLNLQTENQTYHILDFDKNLKTKVVFGGICRTHLLTYDFADKHYYIVDNKQYLAVMKFDKLSAMLTFLFGKLLPMYNTDGQKMNIDPKYKGTMFENVTLNLL